MAGDSLTQYVIGSSSYKTLPPLAAPFLSPSGSMDDSSPNSSDSEPHSPERVGLGGEGSKHQQRRKKKRKGHDDDFDILDSKENNIGQSHKRGMPEKGEQEAEEDADEEENWEWEIRESGGGGRVKSKKTKSRARLPEEWGAPQQPTSPMPGAVVPATANSVPFDAKAQNSSAGPILSSPPAQISTSFTNRSHTSLVTDSPPRSYEPMCLEDFPKSAKVEDKVLSSKPEPISSSLVVTGGTKSALAGDVSSSLALMTGDNLSPVSQTFSFLDSVLQTPPGSTPDSQTTTPITNTPSLASAAPTKPSPTEAPIPASQANSVFSPFKSIPDPPPASALSTGPLAQAATSTLNVDAKPFVPSASPAMTTAITVSVAATTPIGTAYTASTTAIPAVTALSSSASPVKNLATPASPLDTPPKSVAMPISPTVTTTPLSITPVSPPSLLAHSERQESSSSQLPQLEGW